MDRRIYAYRDDVADIALAGRVMAHYYAVPLPRTVEALTANLNQQQSDDATLGSQLLRGERFLVVDTTDEWSWGFGEHDHYVGYLPTAELGAASPTTHIVGEQGAELPGVGKLPLASRLTAAEAELVGKAATALDSRAADPVTVGENFLDAPYLWGGRSHDGIDCSGLVQIAYSLAGHDLPRDSDLQMNALDSEIPDGDPLKRGDIVFFPDHVGLMIDSETLLHATRHHRKTVAEPLADVADRIAEDHDEPIIARKRILS